jgi:hypothetical protein
MTERSSLLTLPAALWDAVLTYVGVGRRRSEPITDLASLRRFLESRAAYVAQTSLYGYLRTRAGMRYPELFDDDVFVRSINIAKWHMWLACLADLAVYAGGMLARGAQVPPEAAGGLLRAQLEAILEATGVPPDAGDEFPAHAARVAARLSLCDWAAVSDGDGAFVESPPALVKWAPIIDELKRLDEAIVRNSVRFRWQEVRRDLRRDLDPAAVMASAS